MTCLYDGIPVLGRYRVYSASTRTMAKWKNTIDSLLDSIKKEEPIRGFGHLPELARHFPDQHDKTLLAINLFYVTRKNPYPGHLQHYGNLYAGREFNLDDIFERKAHPNCIDVAHFMLSVTQSYGFTGSIREIPLKIIPPKHLYYVTNTDRVLDVLVRPALTRLGLFTSEQEYLREMNNIRRARHLQPIHTTQTNQFTKVRG